MEPFAEIDLDAEAIWLDGAWHTREDLARRIKQMVESGEYRVARLSEALEYLESALARTRILSSRVPEELAAALAAAGTQLGRPVGHLVREAVAYYLAAAAAHAAAQKPTAASGDAEADASDDDRAAASFFGNKTGA
jgi:hypothetical protein